MASAAASGRGAASCGFFAGLLAHACAWGGPCRVVVPVRDGWAGIKRLKGIWWMPWRREAMKDVARCEKPRGVASER